MGSLVEEKKVGTLNDECEYGDITKLIMSFGNMEIQKSEHGNKMSCSHKQNTFTEGKRSIETLTETIKSAYAEKEKF